MSGIRLKAAATEIKPKTHQIEIVAYNGGLMNLAELGWVVVDLAGMEIPETTPLVVDHELCTEKMIGSGAARVDNGRRLLISGAMISSSDAAKVVLDLVRIGTTKLQASIGANVVEWEPVQAGQEVFVNGRTIVRERGGFKLITRSELVETSVLPAGADPTTSVQIAARRIKATNMDFEAWLLKLGFNDLELTVPQKEALKKAWEFEMRGDEIPPEEEDGETVAASAIATSRRLQANDLRRIEKIRMVASGNPKVMAAAIEKGWSVERTELEVLRRKDLKNVPYGHLRESGAVGETGRILECSLLQAHGVSEKFLGKHYGEQVVNCAMAKENRGMTLHGTVNAALRAAGRSTGWRQVNRATVADAFEADRMLKASGFSGGSVSGILSNVADKILLNSYQQIATTWTLFAGVQSARNFKPFNSYSLTVKGELPEHGRGGSLEQVELVESEFENKLTRKGAMIKLTSEDIIDDDLNAFAAIPDGFGRLSATGLEKAIYKCLLKNLEILFTTGRLNYFEGNDSALSIASLGVAEQKFLNQIDENGNPLLLVPRLLGVPTKLSATSAVVTRDTSIQHPAAIETAESTSNPHGGKFQPFVSPWFNNANLEGADQDHWFLFAPPVGNQGIVNVAFLNGQQNPTVEQGEVDFSELGMAWRVVFDFGVAVGDYRFGVRSKGKA